VNEFGHFRTSLMFTLWSLWGKNFVNPIFLLFAVLKTTLDCNFVHMYKNIKLLLMINLRLELILINSVINLDFWWKSTLEGEKSFTFGSLYVPIYLLLRKARFLPFQFPNIVSGRYCCITGNGRWPRGQGNRGRPLLTASYMMHAALYW